MEIVNNAGVQLPATSSQRHIGKAGNVDLTQKQAQLMRLFFVSKTRLRNDFHCFEMPDFRLLGILEAGGKDADEAKKTGLRKEAG